MTDFVKTVKIGTPRRIKVPEESRIRFYTGALKVLHADVPMIYQDTPNGVHDVRCRLARRAGRKEPLHPHAEPLPVREEWWIDVEINGDTKTCKIKCEGQTQLQVCHEVEDLVCRRFAASDLYRQGYQLRIQTL